MPHLCMHYSQYTHSTRKNCQTNISPRRFAFCCTECFSAVKRSANSDSNLAIGVKGRTSLCIILMQTCSHRYFGSMMAHGRTERWKVSVLPECSDTSHARLTSSRSLGTAGPAHLELPIVTLPIDAAVGVISAIQGASPTLVSLVGYLLPTTKASNTSPHLAPTRSNSLWCSQLQSKQRLL